MTKSPTQIKDPEYNQRLLKAIEEAEALKKDPNTKIYESVEEYFDTLQHDDSCIEPRRGYYE